MLYLKSMTAVYHDTPESDAQAVKGSAACGRNRSPFCHGLDVARHRCRDPQERRSAADRALQIDPLLPGAHVAKAIDLVVAYWDVSAAIVEVTRALELDPNDAYALRNAADLQAWSRSFDEAERFAREAVSGLPSTLGARLARLDPVESTANFPMPSSSCRTP